VGKGGGYSDLEYGIARTVGAIDRRTVLATTVHPIQIRPSPLPTTAHDFFLDLIVTADDVLRPRRTGRRQPAGILTAHLRPEHRLEVPVLADLLG
jgi:5-formyltetrahydrofolate cyclo-ligase